MEKNRVKELLEYFILFKYLVNNFLETSRILKFSSQIKNYHLLILEFKIKTEKMEVYFVNVFSFRLQSLRGKTDCFYTEAP